MSSILKGADKAYLREYNESEDERRLDALQDSIGSIRKATKGGKYLGSDVIDIMVEIQGFAEKLGIDPDELDYAENQVREAMNNLESAIYGLEEPFEDAIRSLQNRIDDVGIDENISGNKPASIDSEMDAYFGSKPGELEEAGKQVDEMFDDDAFNNIFKADKKDKGTMERPKPKPIPDPEDYERGSPTNTTNEESKGLWANIHAKRKRGEKPAKKGDKAYPKTLDIDEEKQRLDPKCWDGYKKQGTKMKGGKKVNNCVPKESKSHIGQALSEMYDDHVYVLYIDGRKATSAPIAKKQKNELERVVKQALPNANVQFKAVPRQDYSADQLAEGTGKIRGAIAGILLLSGLLGLNNHQAQKMYDQSHQLQQLTQVYMVAKERQDVDKMKEVKRRISNHKTRIDLGKGDVDFDGRPGDDDIKDIGYINPLK
jgi:hypothetical protein|tara:strand:+ start:1025 stop:2311 length:1287 start_codon:yes stop_codon:yes gene_type:complete